MQDGLTRSGLSLMGEPTVAWGGRVVLRMLGSFPLVCLAVLALLLAACDKPPEASPGTIRVGLLPDEKPSKVMARHKPLFKFLEKETGLRFEITVPKSYEALEALFADRAIDMAYFGGLSYVNAHRQSGAVPLASRDVDRAFTSVFLAGPDTVGTELKHFVGLSFSFGSERSTSGHLMPRHFLLAQFIDPENFFSRVEYAGAHDKTIQNVEAGRVALGAANSLIYRQMLADGRLREGKTRVVWETPPYADYVWAVQRDMPAARQDQLVAAFLSLDPANESHAAVLSSVRAGRFLKAEVSDFKQLEDVALSLELVE